MFVQTTEFPIWESESGHMANEIPLLDTMILLQAAILKALSMEKANQGG